MSHNKPGSIGMAQDPGRVFPGKKMAGHLGDVKRTTQNLVIVRIDAERQLLLIRGAVPGAKDGDVTVYPAVKARQSAAAKPAKPARRQVRDGTQTDRSSKGSRPPRSRRPTRVSVATTTKRWFTRW